MPRTNSSLPCRSVIELFSQVIKTWRYSRGIASAVRLGKADSIYFPLLFFSFDIIVVLRSWAAGVSVVNYFYFRAHNFV